jgi:uncharacterized membrane protein SpoIIM required for sporulation
VHSSDSHSRPHEWALVTLMGRSLAFTTAAIFFAAFGFPDHFPTVCTGLIALGLGRDLERLLDRNRDAIWTVGQSPWIANARLAGELTVIFSAIFCGALLAFAFAADELLFREPRAVSEMYKLSFEHLILNNYPVLIVGMLLTLIFGAGGIVLILGWNALHWAQALLFAVTDLSDPNNGGNLYLVAILPHLVVEAVAYVTAGMAGIFLYRALQRYSLRSEAFARVSRASAVTLLIGIILLCAAAVLESSVAKFWVR